MSTAMGRGRPHKEPGQRQLRVGEMLRKGLADVFLRSGIEDPELAGVALTVSQVTVSPDLRQATAFVMPLGGEEAGVIVNALERHKKYVRGELTRRVSLKYMPSISFKIDDTFDESARIAKLLRSPRVAQDVVPDTD